MRRCRCQAWLSGDNGQRGGGKWTSELNEWFKDRDVYVLPDNDEPGKHHAEQVASNLTSVARAVRIVELEGLGKSEDVCEWIAREPFPENLLRIAQDAPLWRQAKPESNRLKH